MLLHPTFSPSSLAYLSSPLNAVEASIPLLRRKKTLPVPSTTLTCKIKHPTHLTWSQVKECNEHPHGLSRQRARKLTCPLGYGSYEEHRHLLHLLFQKLIKGLEFLLYSKAPKKKKKGRHGSSVILSFPPIVTDNNSKSSIYLTN